MQCVEVFCYSAAVIYLVLLAYHRGMVSAATLFCHSACVCLVLLATRLWCTEVVCVCIVSICSSITFVEVFCQSAAVIDLVLVLNTQQYTGFDSCR